MGILTVTLNPALDLETETPHLRPGRKLRCTEPARDPGGGGINVARAISQLGGRATAAVALGGPTGLAVTEQMQEEGIALEILPAPGETRHNLSVIETDTGAQFRFIFPGPKWTAADAAAAHAKLLTLVTPGDWVVLSGSLPPGMSGEALVDLARALVAAGVRLVADTSGTALSALASARCGLAVLRMDSAEAEELLCRRLESPADSAATAAGLVAAGAAEIVILARGAEGSVLATDTERWFAPAADVPVVSVTGAGDSFVAGAVMALARGDAVDLALQHGVAAASAAVTTAATDLCDRGVAERLFPLCTARPV